MHFWIVQRRSRSCSRIVPRLIVEQREKWCGSVLVLFDLRTACFSLVLFRWWSKRNVVGWATSGKSAIREGLWSFIVDGSLIS